MHYQEVRSGLLFLSFSLIFLFDSLGAVLENPDTVVRSVRLSVGLICRGTTVLNDKVPVSSTLLALPLLPNPFMYFD